MDRKYIMIDSTYRDRLLYPNPSEFILPVNAVIGNTAFNSKNPLCSGYPIDSFCFLSNTPNFSGIIVGGNPRSIQVAVGIDALTGISNPDIATTLEQAHDIFLNLFFQVAGDSNTYTIIGYDSVRHIISLDTPVLGFAVGATYTIINTSTAGNIIVQGYSISTNGFTNNQDGYFLSANKPIYVMDLTINETRVGYLNGLGILLDTPFSATWNVGDKYIISINPPVENGTFEGIAPGTFYLQSGLWRFDISSPGVGNLYTQNQEVQIVTPFDARPDYCLAKGRVVFTTPTGGLSRMELVYCGDKYMTHGEYYIQPVGSPFHLELARLHVTATAIGFMNNTSSVNISLIGSFFMPMILTPEFQLSTTLPNHLQISPNNSLPYRPNRILPNLSIIDGDSLNGLVPIVDVFFYEGKQVILTRPFDTTLYARFTATNINSFPEALTYVILPFFRDGCVNMDYRGTMVSSSQMVCYAMAINTLILPNQILNLPFGALTTSYPYVLLEITNETAASGHNKSLIYSNNPNTISATFVCSISDVNSPLITKFINISSDGAAQILKFKPNDNLRFRISMPDGRSFETEIKDYIPPLQPNPLLQINCLIEINRLG